MSENRIIVFICALISNQCSKGSKGFSKYFKFIYLFNLYDDDEKWLNEKNNISKNINTELMGYIKFYSSSENGF